MPECVDTYCRGTGLQVCSTITNHHHVFEAVLLLEHVDHPALSTTLSSGLALIKSCILTLDEGDEESFIRKIYQNTWILNFESENTSLGMAYASSHLLSFKVGVGIPLKDELN